MKTRNEFNIKKDVTSIGYGMLFEFPCRFQGNSPMTPFSPQK